MSATKKRKLKAESKALDHKLALRKIAMLGHGIKEDMRDWQNIGRGAVIIAREALAGTCKDCGRKKEFIP